MDGTRDRGYLIEIDALRDVLGVIEELALQGGTGSSVSVKAETVDGCITIIGVVVSGSRGEQDVESAGSGVAWSGVSWAGIRTIGSAIGRRVIGIVASVGLTVSVVVASVGAWSSIGRAIVFGLLCATISHWGWNIFI